MKHKILYPGAYALLEVELGQGETMKAESDAMVSMSDTVDVEGKMDGGIIGGISRVLAGEKFFFQTLTASRGSGKVYLAPSTPGEIIDVELDGSYNLVVQKDGFLAGSSGLNISTQTQNLAQGFLSGEGFFVVKVSGKGVVFINTYGSIHVFDLQPGEEIVVDNSHLVAWPDYMNYTMDKASKGWVSSFTSGEGVVCRFKGPGPVIIQTRNPKGFGSWIKRFIPTRSNS
ncbi:MAG: TIGR00266 family protein [Firmicutes bacterium]|nr:TIGR00266 family protein [Bacillota bacterium]